MGILIIIKSRGEFGYQPQTVTPRDQLSLCGPLNICSLKAPFLELRTTWVKQRSCVVGAMLFLASNFSFHNQFSQFSEWSLSFTASHNVTLLAFQSSGRKTTFIDKLHVFIGRLTISLKYMPSRSSNLFVFD